jgi:hypothetical protein
MKNLYYYGNKVIGYEDAVEGEIIGVGVGASVFTGSDKACRRKVAELGLDYEGFDLAPIAIPSCTPRQIRLWLLNLGVTDSMVLALINQIPDENVRAATLVEYQYASEFLRNHPFVDSIGLALGLTLDQIDEGFLIASGL